MCADCCDGSDEKPGICKNTCAEAGAAAREALRQHAETEVAGAQLKEAYLKQAQESRAKWVEEEAVLARTIAQQKKVVERLRGLTQIPHSANLAACILFLPPPPGGGVGRLDLCQVAVGNLGMHLDHVSWRCFCWDGMLMCRILHIWAGVADSEKGSCGRAREEAKGGGGRSSSS
jgi:hypothetical protein